jgi:hypothetical protein
MDVDNQLEVARRWLNFLAVNFMSDSEYFDFEKQNY